MDQRHGGDARAKLLAILACALAPAAALGQKTYIYVGDAGAEHVLLAWGRVTGQNTIGRSSPSMGRATVRVGDHEVTTTQNWAMVRGLAPESEYAYQVSIGGRRIGDGRIRTWPERSERLCFFVFGDMGTGNARQYRIAEAMWKQFQARERTGCPIRFVLTTGDNIYGQLGLDLRYHRTGASDREWGPKFFAPYEPLLARVPFYPTLGNHDGNESENRRDLAAYLDNFFFPGGSPARYYRFSYGGLADFFALDTTTNSESGSKAAVYARGSEQHRWLEGNLASSRTPWKIVYFHHPPFSAGPRHPGSLRELEHFLELFERYGVKAAFNGHEHNFQYTAQSRQTRGVRWFVTGGGGELRPQDVRYGMAQAQIEGWASQAHYLDVEIEGGEMRVTPLASEPVNVHTRENVRVEMPVRVRLDGAPAAVSGGSAK
ncbi:MAG: metallophosphoesterase [Acidobacteria bacterium]|nr:metallophosphoesterase [Acidobacteriota bacterium]MBI3279694.1 metallophosphoesterase [Acidobacteriota bacterium]